MNDGALITQLAGRLVDGDTIDWTATESGSSSDHDRQMIQRLRMIADIVSVHRATDAPIASGPAGEAQSTLTPRRWGRLRLMERLGGRDAVEIYRAWDDVLDREVALRLIDDTRGATADDVIKDAARLAHARHENVADVYGAERIDGRVGIWTEFIRGRTLSHILADHGPFGAAEAAVIGRDVCRALSALRAAGDTHTSVSPDTVMREHGGRLVLIAVGHEPGHTGANSADRDGDDVQRVGALLFALVTGTSWQSGLLLRDARSHLPESFIAVIERALATDRDRLFASLPALEDALALTAAPLHGMMPTPARAVEPSLSWWRSRAAGMLAAAVGAALALVLAWWTVLAPPVFQLSPVQRSASNSGPITVAGAWGFSSGDAVIADGRYTFNVSTNAPELFKVQPRIRPSGELKYTPATNAIGTATLTVTLTDHGRPFGREVTSAPQTLDIVLEPAPHQPVTVDDEVETMQDTPLVLSARPFPRGLVHLWAGDNNTHDSMNGGPAGTMLRPVGFAKGRTGAAFAFDGTESPSVAGDAGISFGTDVGNFGADDFTIAFLIKTTTTRHEYVLSKRRDCMGPSSYFNIGVFGATTGRGNHIGVEMHEVGSGYDALLSVRRVDDGQWHSVAVTRSGPVLSIFIDGVYDNSHVGVATATVVNTAEFNLGAGRCLLVNKNNRPLTGGLDEVAVFNRALSVGEIQGLYMHGVLANDVNPAGEMLTATIVAGPSHGTVALQDDGTFVYTPAPGFHGSDAFTYRATDTTGEPSKPSTVTITVMPRREPT